MVKFCKDGSHAVDGALRLARAYTGRDMVAICGDHPFFSTSDWFIGTTEMNAGIPEAIQRLVVKFRYNDLESLKAVFDEHPNRIACVVMEAARTEEPKPGYLEAVKALTHARGAVLVFDEMITGFRWHLGGAQAVYGVTADLCTFGKALANGFSVSALTGRREIMRLGGNEHDRARVFLLSTTHGAETHHLAAAIATMRFYREHPVVETLAARGRELREAVESAARSHGLQGFVDVSSRDCNLIFATRDGERKPNQGMRTLFLQELLRHGVIAPSFVVSYSHTSADVARTANAVDAALAVYRRALDDGLSTALQGRSVKPVFRRFP
jgi:glutamate-1-semialdehyde 2,1-aminomutase